MLFSAENTCQAVILKRYKRFLADVQLDSQQVVTAHVPNTGSMKGCWQAGQRVLLTHHDNPKRKLKYTLEMTQNAQTWIGVNTARTNSLVAEALQLRQINELKNYSNIKAEQKISAHTRIDFLLSEGENQLALEVKNVTLADNQTALFPDAVTTRGQKHLRELIEFRGQNKESAILFAVQRNDVTSFAPAKEIDPQYAQLLQEAHKAGVKILVYQWHVSPQKIVLEKSLPFHL